MKDCLSAERENDKTQFRRWHLGNDISLSSVFLERTCVVTPMIPKSCRPKNCQTGRVSHVPCIRHNFKTLKQRNSLLLNRFSSLATPRRIVKSWTATVTMLLSRLSVSETEEYVCTKTVFMNGSTVRDCQKTYTGLLRQH